MADCSKEFLELLQAYDETLEAILDTQSDSLHVWSNRKGNRVLEYSAKRSYGELWPELERRVLRELPEKDVWRRFGSGKAYDDHLAEQERLYREQRKRSWASEHASFLKENKVLIAAAAENARQGRFSKRDNPQPYYTPTESVGIDVKELSTPKEAKEQDNG